MGMTRFAQAVDVLHLAEAEPARSVASATEIAHAAKREGDPAAASVAERALGIAALHLQDTGLATRHLRAAARLARRADAPSLLAEARLRLAAVLNVAGRPEAALREIDGVLDDASGVDRARTWAQRGAILLQLGRLDAAALSFEHALPGLRAADDRMWLKRVLANRGIVHGRRYRFAAAEADLREALQLNRELGLDLSVAFIQQNLGWVDTLKGDVPRALQHLDSSETTMRRLGAQTGFLLEDKARLLLSVGLIAEAQEAALQSVAALERERQRIALPDVRLLLARVSILDGNVDEALRQARRAAREFTRQRRQEASALARLMIAVARAAGPDRAQINLRHLRTTADTLDTTGWRTAAIEARLLGAELAGERGRGDRGRSELVAASRVRNRGPAADRAMAWQAEAMLRLHDGRRVGALTALRAGLRVLDEHRAGLGATDLRVHTGRQRVALTALGLRTAVADGRVEGIYTWAEHGRASHLLLPPLLPPDDEHLVSNLSELRAAAADVDALRARGADPAPAVRRQVAAERRIRDRTRQRPGTSGGAPTRPVALADVRAAILGAALVEYVELAGDLHALTVTEDRTSWRLLGSAAQVEALVDRLPFALYRLAIGHGAAAPNVALIRDAARRIDEILLAPLAGLIGERPLVVVPTGGLQSLPWSVLPSCAGRPITVAPSATTWHAASVEPPPARMPDRAVVIAGPGLAGAQREAEAVAAVHGTTAISGPQASVETALRLLAGAQVAHFAAHGTIHREHPLFSSLLLADGPLTGYDLERLQPLPRLVVLASCDSGRHTVRAGDELLGLTATFLARGAKQVIASVVPVPDAETAFLMTSLHEYLVAGRSGAEALAAAQSRLRGEPDGPLAAGAGFVCIGGTFRLSGGEPSSKRN
jgi:tetratricopeptide (TPR) repeat protein